ncbi:DUF3300 domain-containing protein [Bradyrhizobium elkanii]|uniref:DUF3300 domain-containing protein n=1 Tax=Bradyrhizobium elkanii TaxID=29448 RepID=UPI00209EFBD5|nr:DUF3300 domain-containing protein [Bradyrhizobium elkanii]MCP1970720.1 hypothetical protein [Bradyrhizobium elkanii]MCS4107773.1 hypothetical protein [Bradyrhizobium elkanii]
MFRWGKTLLAVVLVSVTSVAATAQTADKPPAQASQPAAATTQPADQLLKPEQLEALVAPIALYPDSLLANVLAASTYPLEVVQADRWLKERKSLKGDALKAEVDKQAWDDSVKALASTADVLAMMSDKIDWTKNLGDAVLAQQPDVMDAIQRLRSKAQANNKLVTTKQQKVSVQTQESKQVIVIEQTDPNTVYVPYYDPATVYGAWPYADYPPYYFGYPSYIGAGVIAAGLAFGAGWAIGRWGNYWGGGFNWGNRNVYVNNFNRVNNIGNSWQHNPAHRQGVRYNNSNVQQRFGGNANRAGASDRMDFRGRDGQQVLKPGGDRPGADRAGDRAGDRGDRAGDRAGDRGGDRGGDRAGDRGKGGDRAGAADRAKGGDRAGAGNKAKGGGDRAKAANRGNAGNRAAAANRGGGSRGGAMNVSSGRAAAAASARGRSSMASMPRGGGASFAGRGGGGGGFRGGGGGGGGGGFRGGGGGGRRSDIALKHDIELLGHLANGLGYYRFSYLGSNKSYVGVMAQEVEQIMPAAVTRGADGYLRVYYAKLGLKFRSYNDWLAAGAKIPSPSEASR